jgi:hypothetical protein
MSASKTTHHARFDEDTDEVLAFFRLRSESGGFHGERYETGIGWTVDNYAFDVLKNGQDYEFIPEGEVEDLIAKMNAQALENP